MNRYRPPFDLPETIEMARRRGLIAPGETITDGVERVVRALTERDRSLEPHGPASPEDLEAPLRDALLAGRVAVSSQLMSAAGRGDAVSACTVLPTVGTDDASRERRLVAEAAAASRAGMGCGVDLSDFDDPVRALHNLNAAMRALHTDLVGQDRRPPALMISLVSTHPDIEEFIAAKHRADFGRWVANLSVRVAGGDAEWRRLRPLLAAAAHHNGEPGVLFVDAADADNPTPDLPATSTAPCAEVFLAPGERCVFVSVNLAAHLRDGRLELAELRRSVRLAVRAGDAAVELAADAGASDIVAERRRIGVGITGFASALITLSVPYAHSADLAAAISELVTHTAHDESIALAARRGPFPRWEGSRWRDPAWLGRKAHRRVGAVSARHWDELQARALQVGVRNAAVVAYPPTGVVSNLLGVSRSYEPHFSLVGRTGVASTAPVRLAPEVDRYLDGARDGSRWRRSILAGAADHQVEGLAEDHVLACARQLSARTHVAVHAAFAGFADESGSKTVNLPSHATVAEVAALLDEARRLGLKGLSVFRDGSLDRVEVAA